jgi:protocatechuate 3,4-dioxygenase beta subunit
MKIKKAAPARTTSKKRLFHVALRALITFALVLLICPVTGSAVADNGGSISGTVTNDDGQPLANVDVSVYKTWPSCDGNSSFHSHTDANGNYSVTGLCAGSYIVGFTDSSGNHVHQYYNNKPDLDMADPVSVTTGSNTPNINAVLTGGSISGTVTDQAGMKLANIDVEAYDAATGSGVGYVWTDANGNYFIGGLETGSYKVEFDRDHSDGGNYASQFFNNKPDWASADLVAVSSGNIPNINASLAPGGTITGTVTNILGQPLQGITVLVYDANSGTALGNDYSDANGSYTLFGLSTGSYKVKFNNCWNCNYLTQFYNNKPDLASADAIPVIQGSVTHNINVSLATAGSISGTVVNVAGQAVANINVSAYDATSGSFAGSASTDTNGNYLIGGLATGSYKVEFLEDYMGGGNYITQYYSNKPDLSSADVVFVTEGSTTLGINASLQPTGGMITGHIGDMAGTPMPDIIVQVHDAASGMLVGNNIWTDVYGNYAIGGLATGSYKVSFFDVNGNHMTQFFNNKPNFALADMVPVTQGSITPDINASLFPSGSIQGFVTDQNGQPLSNIEVEVYTDDGFWGGSGSTYGGFYSVRRLVMSGDYKVEFRDLSGNFATQYYNNQPHFDLADPVTIRLGETVGNVDASMAHAVVNCNGQKPDLTLSASRAYWSSYTDYLNRFLSVDYKIDNPLGPDAARVTISEVVCTGGITPVTALPARIADTIPTGTNASATFVYHIPDGVNSFRSYTLGYTEDVCGNFFSYYAQSMPGAPGTYPG